jgi:hypothetical protein
MLINYILPWVIPLGGGESQNDVMHTNYGYWV